MPILRQEPCLFPENLLDERPDGRAGRGWLVLYTMSRQEKAVARHLFRHEVPFYLPQTAKASRRGGRRFVSQIPVFPGYVFFYGDEEERVLSLTTNRISRILPVEDPLRLEADLRQLNRLIESGVPLTLEAQLQPGQAVRVKSGLLEGLEGTILRRQGRCRLLVAVDFLQQGASVEVDDDLLELVL